MVPHEPPPCLRHLLSTPPTLAESPAHQPMLENRHPHPREHQPHDCNRRPYKHIRLLPQPRIRNHQARLTRGPDYRKNTRGAHQLDLIDLANHRRNSETIKSAPRPGSIDESGRPTFGMLPPMLSSIRIQEESSRCNLKWIPSPGDKSHTDRSGRRRIVVGTPYLWSGSAVLASLPKSMSFAVASTVCWTLPSRFISNCMRQDTTPKGAFS
jgi:hypothetical protein